MQAVKTIDELDRKLRECDLAEAVSDDRLRAMFATFWMEPPTDLPDDPFSPPYRNAQMALYRAIAGQEYSLANEATPFEVDSHIARYFPYATKSCVTAGEHLMALGFLLRCMALPAGSRVLEMGFGWGHTTLALAALGHHVTAVDVEARFCELVRRRAAHEGLSLDLVNSDYLWVEETDARFDAVIFFESFHHAADHMRLLRALHRVVSPEGRLFFAAEPIQADFRYPWGLRLDGQSLWSIRKHGWLDLGFRTSYFAEALARSGWFGRRHVAGTPGWLNVWEMQRRETVVFRYRGGDPALRTQVGAQHADAVALRNAPCGTALFGPYIALPAERYVARLRFGARGPRRGTAVMDVSAAVGERPIATRPLDVASLDDADPVAELAFVAEEDLTGVEVRLFCEDGFTCDIEEVEIRPISPAETASAPCA